ncbi:MAG TPA: sigma-70 family RNA polymerase sigma factor [Fimbriimonadaceae bacterium]|nr:sigma-70 family RNA polymerase sigma factor [Fimbriimonadaceae bacterium]
MIGIDSGKDRWELQDELVAFSQAPDKEAQIAFDKIFANQRRRLIRYFMGKGFSEDNAEDLTQEVSRRAWAARRSFEPLGLGAWWNFLLRIARNHAIDIVRRSSRYRQDAFADAEEIPAGDIPYLDVLLREDIFDAADALWLGLPRRQKSQNRSRLLAAQLFYLHGLDWREVAQVLGKDARTASHELDEWLSDGAVLRHLAYVELYWSNDRLAGYLLCPKEPLTPPELDRLNEALNGDEPATRISDWTPREAFVVLRRVRNGLTTDRILSFHHYNFDQDEVEGVAERVRNQYPMARIGKELRDAYEAADHVMRLIDTGLWRRLVFQYDFSDDLPQKQILERTAPPAEVVGTKMTEAKLTGWISMNRLLAQLAAFMSEVPA